MAFYPTNIGSSGGSLPNSLVLQMVIGLDGSTNTPQSSMTIPADIVKNYNNCNVVFNGLSLSKGSTITDNGTVIYESGYHITNATYSFSPSGLGDIVIKYKTHNDNGKACVVTFTRQ